MARKHGRLTLRKRRSSQRKDVGAADTLVYEVEKVVNSFVKDKTIYYEVKWLNYSEKENSKEAEYRMICDDALLAYFKIKVDDNYIDSIPKSLEELEKNENKENFILDIVDPITTVAQTTLHGATVKFASVDTVQNKINFLKYIISHKQSHVLNSYRLPTDDELRESSEKYQGELDQLQKLFTDYPKVKVVFAKQHDNLFYSPPPLSNLLFEPVSEQMFNDRKNINCQFFPMSDAYGFNQMKPFVEPSYFASFDRDKNKDKYNNNRAYYGDNPRFNVSFKLTQQPGYGWNLYLAEPVEGETPLMLMTGVIRPIAAAKECLENEGKAVAFTSYIEIPGTEMCLDRRELYDFSKYIPHSCQPTCGVRLVNSGNDIPDLVVYSLHSIDSSYSFAVTLDYFSMFRQDVRQYFRRNKAQHGKIFALYERGNDFLQCLCAMTNCLGVLHVKQEEDLNDEPSEKKSKPSTSEAHKEITFGGLKLVESDKVYTIEDGKFTDQLPF